jgi:hypothetical protein
VRKGKAGHWAGNRSQTTDAQVAAIAASIKEWGWTTPALVGEDGGLIAGHARVLAARQLGIAEIPVMVAAGWSEAQKRAYVLADNRLAITGSGWDLFETMIFGAVAGTALATAAWLRPRAIRAARAKHSDLDRLSGPAVRDIRYPLGFRHQAKFGSPDQEAVHRTCRATPWRCRYACRDQR